MRMQARPRLIRGAWHPSLHGLGQDPTVYDPMDPTMNPYAPGGTLNYGVTDPSKIYDPATGTAVAPITPVATSGYTGLPQNYYVTAPSAPGATYLSTVPSGMTQRRVLCESIVYAPRPMGRSGVVLP